MNGLGKLLRKKSDPKNRKKTVKNQSAACEQKTTSQKSNFCSNAVFSLYFKIRAKKFHAAKPLACSLHFLFRRDQNHYPNLTSKIMKMCEQILKHSRNSGNDSKSCPPMNWFSEVPMFFAEDISAERKTVSSQTIKGKFNRKKIKLENTKEKSILFSM